MSDDLSIPNPGFRGAQAGRYGMGPRQRRGMDPDTQRLTMFAGGVAAVLLGLIGAFALTGRHGSGNGIPVVDADPRPIREKPLNPGGMKVDGAENDVFSAGSDRENAKLSAPAEAPNAKALQAEEHDAPAVIEMPKPVASAPPPVFETPKPVVTSPNPAVEAPKPVETTAPPPALKVQAANPSPGVKPDSKPQSPTHMAVQFASVSSEDAAKSEWQRLTKRFPDQLQGRQPAFSKFEKDGKLFWRVRTAGFADIAAARTFCEQFRIKGGDCKVADF